MAMAVHCRHHVAVQTLMQIGLVSLPHSLISFDRFVLCTLHDEPCMSLCAFSLMWKKPYLKSMYYSMYRRMKVKNCVRSMSETCRTGDLNE